MVTETLLTTAFRGRRVLVTGDTGFKGGWLCLWLHELGAEVQGLAWPHPTGRDLYHALRFGELLHHTDCDIRDLPALQAGFTRFQPEVVFHLAAQALVRKSHTDPKLTFDINVAGSVNVLEAVRATPSVKALVCVSSDKCYRNNEWVWGYRESDALGGHGPYSASKAALEIMFSAYQDSFFSGREALGAATVRAGNVIGGGDWAEDRIVPDAIRALGADKPVPVRNPDAVRPWQHVLDPLSGYLCMAARLLQDPKRYSGAWNFGPNPAPACSVESLVGLIIRNWGQGEMQVTRDGGAPHEARTLRLNCDKAHQLLDWWPRWGVERAVAETVTWYRKVRDGADPREVSRQQLARYVTSQADDGACNEPAD